MKKIIILLAVSFSFLGAKAQELSIPAQAQYLQDNPFSISPTFAGIGDNVRIRVNGMAQWIGIRNAPLNQSLFADFRIADRDGVGLQLYNDRNGNTRQYGVKASFAHHLILDEDTEQFLSLGISFNLNQFKIEIENFDPIPDSFVTDNRFTQNYNFDVGFLYRIEDFFLAFTGSNILDKNIDNFNKVEPSKLRNFQVYAGNRFRQKNSNVEFEPSLFYQYFQSDKRSTTDANIKIRFHDYEDYYWAGITARFLNDQTFEPVTLGPMIGLRKSNFYFGYSYQVTTNKLLGYNSGTHTITLGFDFLQNLSNCPCTHDRLVY